ncbi:MAG TPA: sugar O-acetyltransferase [Casimicrobiaceae bacterium]|nr:sugar O-acetyltransferase [Casimicrobiaceae bacterium]
MPSERDKMVAGELYDPRDAELTALRLRARKLCRSLNDASGFPPAEIANRVRRLIVRCGERLTIEPPFFCDYGFNIALGDDVFMNFNCVILDVAPVTIGSRVLFAPLVQVYTATHPLSAIERRSGLEFGKPITIGDDVWIGGGAIIGPGVTIAERSVIGAGSVVTRDIPAGVLAAGNPCRVLRELEIEA